MSISVRQAKVMARQWVTEEAGQIPGYAGAFLHGSLNDLPDDTLLPPTSDVDVMVVLAEDHPPVKIGKFAFRDVLLEVSHLPFDQLQSPEMILENYQLAGDSQEIQCAALVPYPRLSLHENGAQSASTGLSLSGAD